MIRNSILSFFLLLLITIAFGEKEFFSFAPYPTDFFKREFNNNRPIIGVLTTGLDGAKNPLKPVSYLVNKAYVGASYVKFIEQAGARVVPIVEDMQDKNFKKLLTKLNGVLLPGNDADTGDGGYFYKVKEILAYSKKQTAQKKKFPVLGIGRGAQRIIISVSGKDSLEEGDALNLTAPLFWRNNDLKTSKMFGKLAPRGVVEILGKKPVASFFSENVLPAANYFNDTKLTKTIRALSVNIDRNGTKFVSTFESINHPWYGLLWHPEKSQFEFNPTLSVDHTVYSIFTSQFIANFFVSEARENENKFDGRWDENKYTISKYRPYFVGNITNSDYDQVFAYDMKKIYSAPQEETEEK